MQASHSNQQKTTLTTSLPDQIASDEALARYLQYGSDGEGERGNNNNATATVEEGDEEVSDSESEYDESEGEEESEDEDEEYEGNFGQHERPTNANVTRKVTNTRFETTQITPQGLHYAKVTDEALLADALREANSVFDGECAGQIASNTHFFVNLPFPIGGSREAGTAIFDLDDARITRLSELIRHTLKKLSIVAGGKKVMHEGMLARANIIVRRYTKGQHISFHIDERECASSVFGFILQNDHPQHKGLEFRRGEDKKQLSYVMQEYPGTAFILTHESRYKWKHGLAPVSACRVSVTCRFFKTDVFANHRTELGIPKPLKSWQQRRLKKAEQTDLQDPQQTQTRTQPSQPQTQTQAQTTTQQPKTTTPDVPKPTPTKAQPPSKPQQSKPQPKAQSPQKQDIKPQPAPKEQDPEKPEDIHIELCLNKDPHQTKPALVSPSADIKQLIAAAKNKLRIKAKKFFVDGGIAVTAGHTLQAGETVYVSLGEDFTAANKAGKKPAQPAEAQPEDPNAGFGIAVVRERIAWWAAYRYAQLRFWIAQDLSGKTTCRGTPIPDATQLGQLIAASHLSIPEMREIVLALRDTVEDAKNGLTWGFHTAEWADGRSTSICVMRPSDGAWVEFVAEGKPTVKGARKRDGPLWKLEGGLNNPSEIGGPVKLLSEVAAEVNSHDSVLPSKNAQRNHVDRGDDEDEVARRKRKPKKKKEQNLYQSKRGVEFTDKYVLFAGTVWCSSYYTCTLEIDGIKYTSSTQFVMSEQARLFGDEARRQELLAASNAAAPHREFDHKAPKTGVRRVNNFDADVWKTYKERLMWRGTYEKFTQNQTLRHKALEAGDRTFVEATEDPMWGIGILLSHPDAKNEQKWRGPNLMGRMLTAMARLLHAERDAPDALSHARVTYLRDLAQSIESEPGDLLAFGDRALNQTGDPDLFTAPGWPGTQAMREAVELCKDSKATLEGILEGLGDSDKKQESFQKHRPALLYLVEGVLGLRWV